jgi:putative methionine-R-sulfoxide reductase with GAF domain
MLLLVTNSFHLTKTNYLCHLEKRVVLGRQDGLTTIQVIGLFAVLGLITSLLAFLRYDSIAVVDPVLVFLLFAYPFLIGTAVYFYLQDKNLRASLQEEYFTKWFLQSFAKVCLSETDPQIIREELAGTILRLVKPALVSVYELNPHTQLLEVVYQAGIKNLPDAATRGYAFGEGIPGWVMENQNTVILPDISKEQYLQVDNWAKTLDLRSYAAVPVLARGQPIGIIAMYSLTPSYFQDANVLIVQIATQLYGLSHGTLSQS